MPVMGLAQMPVKPRVQVLRSLIIVLPYLGPAPLELKRTPQGV